MNSFHGILFMDAIKSLLQTRLTQVGLWAAVLLYSHNLGRNLSKIEGKMVAQKLLLAAGWTLLVPISTNISVIFFPLHFFPPKLFMISINQ